jgi:ethanolamine permease
MISLFVLRKKEPELARPFKAPLYPYFPAIALLLSTIALAVIVYYYTLLSILFFLGLGVIMLLFFLSGKYKQEYNEDHSFAGITETVSPL